MALFKTLEEIRNFTSATKSVSPWKSGSKRLISRYSMIPNSGIFFAIIQQVIHSILDGLNISIPYLMRMIFAKEKN